MNPENDTQQQMAEIAAEDLIEEVSIDGMCGVY
ncbi:MAG TPA: mycofactocin precursor MftA [Nocardioides sp.]|nr:mycofactocin precursor MftA [Nocardioides sp.]